MIKNILKNTLTGISLIIGFLGFSQDNESVVDSVFKLTTNSINKNNYYLTYEVNERYQFDSEKNKDLKWVKNNLEVLWVIPSMNLETTENVSWENVNWVEANSNPDVFLCETTNNIPNGKWKYKGSNKTIIGNFKNGLADGAWDVTETIQNKTRHVHQEFRNGIPNGEWYEEHNGIKWYSHVFLNGKPNGLWLDNFRNKKRETEYKNGCKNGVCKTTVDGEIEQLYYYSNGIINGEYFEYSNNTLIKKGSYDMGKPNKIWETYKIDKTTKIRYLAYQYDFSNILKVKITENYSNSKPRKIEIYENNGDLIFGGVSSNKIVSCNQNNGVCNKETITYFANGNTDKIVYGGSKEYLANKKFVSYFENGKIKYEGIFGGNLKHYDLTGKIVSQSLFSIEPFTEIREN
jgi:antitoxin component YwqK of YwqJK toxin-antitoxin module